MWINSTEGQEIVATPRFEITHREGNEVCSKAVIQQLLNAQGKMGLHGL